MKAIPSAIDAVHRNKAADAHGIGAVTGLRADLNGRISRKRYYPRPVKATPIALFESTETWTGGAVETTIVGMGLQSRKVTSADAANVDVNRTLPSSIAWDATSFPFVELLVYIDDATKLTSITPYFAVDAAFTRYAFATSSSVAHAPFVNGWNAWRIAKSDFNIATGGWQEADWNSIGALRVRCKSTAGNTVNIYLAALRFIKPRGIVILNHDDGRQSINDAWTIEEKYGLRSANFVCSDKVGTTGATTYQTWDELWSGYLSGHDISNHTATHPHLSSLDAAGKTAEVQSCYNALIGRGFSRSARFFSAPYGEYSADITAAVSPFHKMNRSNTDTTGAGTKYPVANEYGASTNCYASVDVNNVDTPDISVIRGYVTAAASSGKLLSLLTHGIGDEASTLMLSSAAYDELCAHIAAADVDCLTWSEFFDTATPQVGGPHTLPSLEQRVYVNPAGALTVERTV